MPDATDVADRLVAAFAAHPLCRDDEVAATADLLLHYRRYVDDRLDWWTADRLDEVLLGVFPAKVVVEEDEVDQLAADVGAFLEFLATTGRLARGSDPLPELRAALERIARELPAALADRSRFGWAKSLGVQMGLDGVDLGDDRAVQGWIDAFNARPRSERDAVFALGFDDAFDDDDFDGPPGRLSVPDDVVIPPVALAPTDELAAAAATVPAMERMATLLSFMGDGRRLTRSGNLTVADGVALAGLLGTDDLAPYRDRRPRSSTDLPEVDFTFAWADAARLVDVTPAGLVPASCGRDLAADPLHTWTHLFEGLLEIGALDDRSSPWWSDILNEGMADLIVLAHLADEPLALTSMAEDAWTAVAATGSPAARFPAARTALERDIDRVVAVLEEVGVLARTGDAVTATPLGRWAAVQLLRDDGYDVVVRGELADADARDLLLTCAEMEVDDAEAEIDTWLARRPAAAAVKELAAAVVGLRDLEDHRPMLLHVLERLGPEAVDAVRDLDDDEWLRPYARAWLVMKQLLPPDSISADDVESIMVDQLAVALALAGPEGCIDTLAAVGPASDQATLIGRLWRVPGPSASEVLEAVAAHHPDKPVAKAARKALFKRRSASG